MKNKFRAYNRETNKIMQWEFIKSVRNLHKLLSLNHVVVMQFTGFKDSKGQDIYDGDQLVWDDVQLEKGVKLQDTTQQVYWCDKTGAWMLDDTFKQNKQNGTLLSEVLKNHRHSVIGSIYNILYNNLVYRNIHF